MYLEANKKACSKHEMKKRTIDIIHFVNDEGKTKCNKHLSFSMLSTNKKELTTCSVCRKLLGLQEIIVESKCRISSLLEVRLSSKLEVLKMSLKETQDQITITEALLEEEIRLSVENFSIVRLK